MHPGRGWADTPSSIAATIPTGQAKTQGQEVRARTLVPRGKGLRRRRHREKRRGCPLPLTTSLPVVSLLCPHTSDLPSFLLTSPPWTVFGHRSPPLFRREKAESTAAVVCVCVFVFASTPSLSQDTTGAAGLPAMLRKEQEWLGKFFKMSWRGEEGRERSGSPRPAFKLLPAGCSFKHSWESFCTWAILYRCEQICRGNSHKWNQSVDAAEKPDQATCLRPQTRAQQVTPRGQPSP